MADPAKLQRPYRDDPDAVSLHTTPGESSEGVPPSYEDATTHSSVSGIQDMGVPSATPRRMPNGKPTGINEELRRGNIGSSSSKVIGRSTRLVEEVNKLQERSTDSDPQNLEEVIREMARHAPTPYIQVIGTHTERQYDQNGKSKGSEEVTDFSIMINMRNYLWPNFDSHATNSMDLRTIENGEKSHRGTVFKTRAPGYSGELEVGDSRPDLKEWCHRYCASAAHNRIFRMTRTVTNMDTQLLKDRVEGLIRSTNYRGKLEICFPIADRYVDIYTTNRVQTWRLTTWIRWLFYLTFLWIFSWPFLFFTTKRWAVVRAEWPFALVDARGGKTYTTVSEEEWIGKFGPAIKQLAVDRFKGETGDDHLSLTLHRVERDGSSAPPVDIGRAVNSAVSAWRGGLNAQNLLRMGASNDPVGWGFNTS